MHVFSRYVNNPILTPTLSFLVTASTNGCQLPNRVPLLTNKTHRTDAAAGKVYLSIRWAELSQIKCFLLSPCCFLPKPWFDSCNQCLYTILICINIYRWRCSGSFSFDSALKLDFSGLGRRVSCWYRSMKMKAVEKAHITLFILHFRHRTGL